MYEKRNACRTTWPSALLGKFLANVLLASPCCCLFALSKAFWSSPCEKHFDHKSAPVIPSVCPRDFQIEARAINHCLFSLPVAS